MTSPDMAQYLGLFLDEAHEQIALLENDILALERGDHSSERLQTLFRAAHTLKGSSRAMGFLAIGDLTHELENVLDGLRSDALIVSPPIINALLECLDALTALVGSVSRTGTDSDGQLVSPLIARLSALRAAPTFSLTEHEHASLQDAQAAGLAPYRVDVTLRHDCCIKSLRVFMVMGALEPLGSVLASHPSEAALEAEQFDRAFSLLLASERPQAEIEAALAALSEIESVGVSAWEEAAPSLRLFSSEKKTEERGAAAASLPTVRVDVARLDALLNLVGELVIDRAQAARLSGELCARYPQDKSAEELSDMVGRIARTTAELQNEVMKARMLPADSVFQRMPRMVRDLAQKTGKEVSLQISGGETELDRSVLENLGDPLIQLLRNSIDHGLEPPEERLAAGKPAQGSVRLTARHQENQILVEVSDDGRGMAPNKLKATALRKGILTESEAEAMGDKDALSLIFASGFSTAQTISDISGRGVGMDIVRANLEKIGARLLVDSQVGAGSRFQIFLPLTLAIARALLVKAGESIYVLPLTMVIEVVRLGQEGSRHKKTSVGGQAALSVRGRTVPLALLSQVLTGSPLAVSFETIADTAYVVVVGFAERQVGLCVDGLVGEQEVVIKSLGTLLGDIPGICGATILGDGRVALIVDAAQAVAFVMGMAAV